MSKMKKLFAMLLTLVMIMALGTTTMAETKDNATITVNEADEAIFQYIQVIKPSDDSATGWVFTSDEIAKDYINALNPTNTQPAIDAQTAIAMLIKYEYTRPGATLPDTAPTIIKNASPATATQINQALDNVLNGVQLKKMENPQSVTEAGVYAIKATQTGFTYKAMAAYVGFGTVTIEEDGANVTYEYPSLKDASLTAKKIPTTLTKKDYDSDNAVSIGQKVKYTLTTSFPYFNKNDIKKTFKISDAITGAEHFLEDDEETEVDETATIKIGDINITDVEFNQNDYKNRFEIDLSKYITDENTHAGKTVVVTYYAIMKATQIENTAVSHIGDEEVNSETIKHYTGKITLVKTDVADDNKKLADAGFEVKKSDEVLTFVQKDESTKVYTYDPNGTITEVFTDGNGNVVVEGLDIGTYTFTEKTAPKGYSINENPVSVELLVTEKNEKNEATAIFEENTSMKDTKLSALPSTGGIGTTIFTIGGCAIMIAAAFFFFVSRRKDA